MFFFVFFLGGAIPVVDLCSLVIRKILGFRFGLFLMFLSLQLYIYTCHWPVPRRFGTNKAELDLGTSLDPLQLSKAHQKRIQQEDLDTNGGPCKLKSAALAERSLRNGRAT